jgi:hypothetical protein
MLAKEYNSGNLNFRSKPFHIPSHKKVDEPEKAFGIAISL